MARFGEFFLRHWDLFLALGIILGLLLWQGLRGKLSGVKGLDPSEAVQVINRNDALVLDVREDAEYREGHIIGAKHIPLANLDARLTELGSDKDKTVLVSCRSGGRSAQACGVLKKNGFTHVYNLQGGMLAWQSAGLPVAKGGKKR